MRANLTGHGHPSRFWKIAKMALFYPWLEFKKILDQITAFEVLWKCHIVILSKLCLKCMVNFLLSIPKKNYIIILSPRHFINQFGSTHIWRQMFWGYFWPTYPNQMLSYISLFSKIRWPTYIPKNLTSYICECSQIGW